MVVFTCGHCGESVQKPKVEKHYMTKCRNRSPNLSCMDCFKDFFGQDYEAHNKCITEEERYSGKGYVSKEKKGEKKQNTWVEMLQSVLDEQPNASCNVIKIIETVSKHSNTPRKKPKFINFVKNVCGHKTNPKDMDKAWDLISVKLAELSNATRNQNQNKESSSDTKDSDNDINQEKVKEEEPEEDEKPSKNLKEDDSDTGVQPDESEDTSKGFDKKMTKKQLREEKKRQKYEAELQSATERPEEVTEKAETKKQMREEKKRQKHEAALKSATENLEDEVSEELESKNDKIKKNKFHTLHDENVPTNGKKEKNKKRKRLDTVGSNCHVEPCDTLENVAPSNSHAGKTQKKKQRMEEENADENLDLHDQNVANIGKLAVTDGDQFDWHGVIIAVLQKKDNEISYKRLQKKVLDEFEQTTGQVADDRIAEKFIKRIKSAPNVRVDKNKVVLLS